MPDTTIRSAAAALRRGQRLGLAHGARLNADSRAEMPRERQFWLALGDVLNEPIAAREGDLRASVADLDGDLRLDLRGKLCASRDLVTQSDPVLAEFWSEVYCLVAEVDHEQRTAWRNLRAAAYAA